MILMRNKPKPGRPKGLVKTSVLQLRLHPKLKKQLTLLVDRNTTSITTEVSAAIRDRLAAVGLWPPPSQDSK